MKTRHYIFVSTVMVLATFPALSLRSQEARTISSFQDYSTTEGRGLSVAGMTLTEPDIYYIANGDNTYQALRLTVQPKEIPAAVTAPYLNESTDHSMQVCWKTDTRTNDGYVRYGRSADALDYQVPATNRQIATRYVWNRAQLTGLEADTEYFYQVVNGEHVSEVYRFKTLPSAESKEPFRILLIGDHQRNERSDYEWLLRMAKRKLDEKYGEAPLEDHVRLLMNVGDQVDSGSVRQYEFTHLYKSREVMSRLPIMTCVGNHELFKDEQLQLYKGHYSSYGEMVYQGISSHTALYYAYQAGPVLFVVMNTDGTTVAQKQWVERVVTAAEEDTTVKFIVSVQHRPLYAEQWASDTNPWMTNEVMGILSTSRKHVLNCAGHHHLYARGQMTEWSVYHIISGGGVGTSAQDYEQLWGYTPDNRNRDEVQKTIDQWTYQLLEFDPTDEEMTVETYSIGNRRLALDNVLIDRFSRRLSSREVPDRPTLKLTEGEVVLPAKIEQTTKTEGLHSCEYEIARDGEFEDVVFRRILLCEDFYDVRGGSDEGTRYLPKNVREGLSVTELPLSTGDIPSGEYYIRSRNRSMNLDWSDYSVPQRIRVTGSTSAQLNLSTTVLKVGGVLDVSYENAPVGTNAWVGVYLAGQQPGGNSPSYAWKYTSGASGTLSFTIENAGSYFAVLFGDNGYTEICARVPFIVSEDTSGPVIVSDEPVTGGMTLVEAGLKAAIVVDAEDAEVVRTAADCLADDIERVTGQRPEVKPGSDLADGMPCIIAGTVGQSALIDRLTEQGKLDVSEIAGTWETYILQRVSSQTLVVAGSTPRGTAYGLLELSRMMGVSPWVWWADVAPTKKEALYVSGERTVSKEPSVKYRGIFINDEDFALFPWASKGIDKKYNNIGPNTYAKVMELLLRLRANTLWPAMHLCSQAFWANKDNLPVAKKYDIMLGSSHCEQMLRDNEWEWRHEPYNGTNEDWNYVTNKTKIQGYWEERVKESVGYDGMYTLGMRGVHDWGISGYPSTQDKVRGLTEIIGFQRSLLSKYFDDVTKVPQLFIPYKEVLDAYNAGLQVPEDVTLCWVDDNHGYIRQLPRADEQARAGGNGIYYHLSYWGTPADYLWLCSHSPSLISYELSRAYDQGVRTLWIINVGDIKPAEMELEFCMDLAWDVEQWSPEKAFNYSRCWAARTFGEQYADELAAIKRDYYRLAAGGKPEHVHMIDYTYDDMDRRIADYTALAQQVDELKARIPDQLQDAFFQLVEYPIKGACYMNVKTFRAAQSIQLARLGQGELAMQYATDARTAYRTIGQMTTKYNSQIATGKWKNMMNFKPRDQQQFNMPETASQEDIRDQQLPIQKDDVIIVPATAYHTASSTVKTIQGLGINLASITVWPLDMKTYGSNQAAQAPYAEYNIPVKAGNNHIEVRCLPNFPVNTDYDLRIALAIDAGTPVITSLKTIATEGKWNTTVVQGYNDASIDYVSTEEKTISLRVSFMDPGLVVSEIRNTIEPEDDMTLTEQLIENHDFEYNHDCQPNPPGNVGRGIPCGWLSKGELKKGANGLDSYGVNQDASNYHADNVCWINSTPMPSDFWLYQTISANKLQPGTYRISCLLWVENGKKTNCRLFANNNVQYYGYPSDYTNLLTPGEENTYAGYAGGSTSPFILKEMEVYVTLVQGEDLTIGIKTSNRRNDGTNATDNAGWFKVDYFRISRVTTTDVKATTDIKTTNHSDTYDLSGRKVSNVNRTTLNDKRSHLPKGIYIHNAQKYIK